MPHSIHPDTDLGEVKLKVKNLERSAQFYKDVVGLKVLKQDGDTVYFTADGQKVLLVLEAHPDSVILPQRTTTGLYHFAILVPDRKQLGLALRNLIQAQIHIGQADHLVSEALYISDPEGNGIEIYRDRPRDTWERDAQGNYKMATDPIEWESLLQEAGDEPWSGLHPETIIGHVHLHVADLKSSNEFYTRLLGFDIVGNYAGFSALFVSAGGYHHHLGLNIWAGAGAPNPPSNAAGLDYYTIMFPNRAERDLVVKRLADAGVSTYEQDTALFVNDPSNNRIKLAVKA
jgi:catechol 2,3-dioxygenase